jgi:hypothetical protein
VLRARLLEASRAKSIAVNSRLRSLFALPRIEVGDGAIEALKWLAVSLMTADHINKYLLHESESVVFAAGRLALPLFIFVLAHNLARPGTLQRRVYPRVIGRLAVFGSVATVPFFALGGLAWGWWPLNIMFCLLIAATIFWLIDAGGIYRLILAIIVFLVGGAVVEFCWPALLMAVGAWAYCRRPGFAALSLWVAGTASLVFINKNYWAMCSLPIIFLAPYVRFSVPRLKMFFYIYYPLHLAVLWVILKIS